MPNEGVGSYGSGEEVVMKSGSLAGMCLAVMIAFLADRGAAQIAPPLPDEADFAFNGAAAGKAGRVFGFVASQNLSLDMISEAIPELSQQAAALKKEFIAAYGFPEFRARWFLDQAMGPDETNKLEETLRDQLFGSGQPISEDDARAFMDEMRARLVGDLDDTVLKGMLWLRYASRPASEMRDRQQKFSSAGHPKSNRLEVTMRLPYSWRQEEADRPNIVSKWTNQDGSGDMVIMMTIMDVGYPVTRDDLDTVVADDDWGWFLPEGSELIEGKVVTLDRQPGVQIDMRSTIEKSRYRRPSAVADICGVHRDEDGPGAMHAWGPGGDGCGDHGGPIQGSENCLPGGCSDGDIP